MKYKHIEASREVRLWISQVIAPAFLGCALLLSNDEIRTKAAEKYNGVKESIKSKFNK